MEIVVTCALLGLIPAMIAKAKGRDPVAWWFYGALLFIVALIHVLFVSDLKQEQATKAAAAQRKREQESRQAEQAELRDCPYCAEPIKKKAVKCKHCGSEVEPQIGDPEIHGMATEELQTETARQASYTVQPKTTNKIRKNDILIGLGLVAFLSLAIYQTMKSGNVEPSKASVHSSTGTTQPESYHEGGAKNMAAFYVRHQLKSDGLNPHSVDVKCISVLRIDREWIVSGTYDTPLGQGMDYQVEMIEPKDGGKWEMTKLSMVGERVYP